MNNLEKSTHFTVPPKIVGFKKVLSHFSEFGSATKISNLAHFEKNIPVFSNAFWTAQKRSAHSLHEIPYRACFKPELTRFLIEHLSSPEDLVYDPFMGRGTTLLEAALLGRKQIGNDVNPLSQLLFQPRLSPPSQLQVQERLSTLTLSEPTNNHQPEPLSPDLLTFFHPETLKQLLNLKHYMRQRLELGKLDPIDQWLQMVATTRLTGHSNGFFSVYTLPPNQAVSAERQRCLNLQRNISPEPRDITSRIIKKSKSLLRNLTSAERQLLHHSTPQLYSKQAHETPEIATNNVDLVITSPPFLDVISYPKDNWLRCWFNDIDPNEVKSLHEFSPRRWQQYMIKVLSELSRVLSPTGSIAIEVGEMSRRQISLENLLIEAAAKTDLIPQALIIHQQDFAKTAHCWGIKNSKLGTNSNRILILSK